jgi:cell division protease FtsH
LNKELLKNILLWLVIALILILVFNSFGPKGPVQTKMSYSEFLHELDKDQIASVLIVNQTITGLTEKNAHFETYMPMEDQNLIPLLVKNNVKVVGQPPEKPGFLEQFFLGGGIWFLLLIVFWYWMFRQQMGGGRGGSGPFSFGRSRAKLLMDGQVKITFNDVAGCDEAKEDVKELVDFLRDPKKFSKLGGRVPRGVLLMGAPGTGKTLLAKAVAGEASVPFFSISGSDFVEMFVGVGASRVRDMFDQAKKQAPCIIFIDELDAVGRHRGAGLSGGHDEREQTLNQLLVEMDGFEGQEGVIVLAATNRPDVLDPALLRPGRFDRQVVVSLPDIRGREKILEVHAKKVPLDKEAKLGMIARGTPGFSGADLANLINEAALIAARQNKKHVDMGDLEHAKDKIMMGAERKSMVMSEEEKNLTAYHEAGHAIIGRLMPSHDPVYKVTIIPRGRALGVTMFLPEQDRYSLTKQRIESQIASMFGGRIAEELAFGPDSVTTGASNDIKRATELARNMVTQWGLSDNLGPLSYGEEEGEIFLGQSLVSRSKEIANSTAEKIDVEIRTIIDRNYKKAEEILKANKDILHTMAEALMKYETLDLDQISDLMEKKPVREPVGWSDVISKQNHVEETPVETEEEEKPKRKKRILKKAEEDTDL